MTTYKKIEEIRNIYNNDKIEEIANAIFDNLKNWSLHLWADIEGNFGIRQNGSLATWEEDVLFTIPVNAVWWEYDTEAEGNDTKEHRRECVSGIMEEVDMCIDIAIEDYKEKLEWR